MNNENTFNTTNPVPEPASSDSIVVGHDGSRGAGHAFTMAMELAAELSAPVVVVRSWSILTAPRPADWEYGYVSSFAEYTAAVREEMMLNLKDTAGKYDKVQVTYEPVHAPPAKSLIDISQECPHAGGWNPRARRTCRDAAGLGERAMCAACRLPGPGGPAAGLNTDLTATA